eukprot:354546_1
MSHSLTKSDAAILLRILTNIIQHPKNPKYQDLNVSRITKKFDNCSKALRILYDAGFYQSGDSNRLLFDINKLNTLEALYVKLSLKEPKDMKHALHYKNMNSHLKQFGYQQKEILSAFKTMKKKHAMCDINGTVDQIESNLEIKTPDKRQYNNSGQIQSPTNASEKMLMIKENASTYKWACPRCTLIQTKINKTCKICGYVRANPSITASVKSEKYPGFMLNDVCHDIGECLHAKRFCTMNRESKPHIDEEYLRSLVDDYMHLIHYHSTDEDFEWIFKKLKPCNIVECQKIRRNQRDTDRIENDVCLNTVNMMYQNIYDKIHCHFCHCYDVGHRLSSEDKILVENSIKKETKNAVEKQAGNGSVETHLINNMLSKTEQILRPRHKSYRAIYYEVNRKSAKKYQNFELYVKDKKLSWNNFGVYGFGCLFDYGDEKENNPTHISVSPTYANLKEELTSNSISKVNIQQFNNEYRKAGVYFASQYCKQRFRPTKTLHSISFRTQPLEYNYRNTNDYMSKENIVSMMMYCNYTTLQYEFSKTYRIDNGKNHTFFYHLGKNLNTVIKKFGTTCETGSVHTFYDGIGQPLLFPELIYKYVPSDGIAIHGPLSTSSSFEVAANFTNYNNGMVIKFTHAKQSKTKYFHASWLSDYGNEDEYLFIQNSIFERLYLNDIVDMRSGYEYGDVLKALKTIENITNKQTTILKNSDHIVAPISLVIRVLSNQLAKKLSGYSSFLKQNRYLNDLCQVYFGNKRKIEIYYTNFRKYTPLRKFFFHAHLEWVDMRLIDALFPNLNDIDLKGINLCAFIMDDILKYLKNEAKLKVISISAWCHSDLSVKQAVIKYEEKFKNIKYTIKHCLGWKKIMKYLDVLLICKIGYMK